MEERKKPVDWQPWINEMNRFKARDTQGFQADIEALKVHIERLKEVAPKSKFGTIHSTAQDVINSLTHTLSTYIDYQEQNPA